MGRFTELLDYFIQKFQDDGEFFGLSYHIHYDKTISFNIIQMVDF